MTVGTTASTSPLASEFLARALEAENAVARLTRELEDARAMGADAIRAEHRAAGAYADTKIERDEIRDKAKRLRGVRWEVRFLGPMDERAFDAWDNLKRARQCAAWRRKHGFRDVRVIRLTKRAKPNGATR
jgi:hypothetical protein